MMLPAISNKSVIYLLSAKMVKVTFQIKLEMERVVANGSRLQSEKIYS